MGTMTLRQLIEHAQAEIAKDPAVADLPVHTNEWEDDNGDLQGGGRVDGIIVVGGQVILI